MTVAVVVEAEEASLEALGAELRRHYAEAEASFRRGIGHIIAGGEILIEAKGRLRHGQWLPYLKEYFPASADTAENWMEIARNSERVRNSPSLRQALKMLSTRERGAVVRAQEIRMGDVIGGRRVVGVRKHNVGPRVSTVWKGVTIAGYWIPPVMVVTFESGLPGYYWPMQLVEREQCELERNREDAGWVDESPAPELEQAP